MRLEPYRADMGVADFDPDPDEPGYLFVKLADYLTARIRARDLPPGSRLPGERDLSVQYGVSIGTVRRATEVLRERGLVLTFPAKGTFVAPLSRLRRVGEAPPPPHEPDEEP